MELKKFFPEIDPEKRLALGCMRLPLNESGKETDVDFDLCDEMVDRFMDAGFNYFDTARVYHGGVSEQMIKRCIADRYPRESFVLTDKLSDSCFRTEEDIRPLFEDQLRVCGVSYFDFYLMHSLHREIYDQYQNSHAFEIAQELKAEGKIRHVGISFHDDAEFLEQILNDHPEIEIVQIQFNYFDFNSPSIQSGKLYEICEKYDKPILVMEPVRGGSLAKVPPAAEAALKQLWERECENDPLASEDEPPSAASYALRFAASFPQIAMVLSGSTACRYCTAGCPQHISIPDLFSDYNNHKLFKTWNSNFYYEIHTGDGGRASDCIKCGQCEIACPQKLPIRKLLEQVATEFEK